MEINKSTRHSKIAGDFGETLVVSIRFPSVEVGDQAEMPAGKTDSAAASA